MFSDPSNDTNILLCFDLIVFSHVIKYVYEHVGSHVICRRDTSAGVLYALYD